LDWLRYFAEPAITDAFSLETSGTPHKHGIQAQQESPMRKFLIPAAILASTLAAAAPAAAQWAPNGNAYGYNNYGQGRRLEVRVMQLRRQIAQLDRRNILRDREARRLDAEARNIEYRIRELRQYGIDSRERYTIERRIARLEQNIRYQANDGDRRYADNNGYGNGYNDNGYNNYDRDRDGRDDRYEDDRGRDFDGRGDGKKDKKDKRDHDRDDD